MANIINITNQIGKEVTHTLRWRKHRLYYQETVLLFSLCENMLKYMVAMKKAWDINSDLVDELDAREARGEVVSEDDREFDFGAIRQKAAKLTFAKAISEAHALMLIPEDLKDRLETFRMHRNDIVHELYLFNNRNKPQIMRQELIDAQAIIVDLLTYFEYLMFKVIGVDTDEVFQTLDVI